MLCRSNFKGGVMQIGEFINMTNQDCFDLFKRLSKKKN